MRSKNVTSAPHCSEMKVLAPTVDRKQDSLAGLSQGQGLVTVIPRCVPHVESSPLMEMREEDGWKPHAFQALLCK